MKTKLAPLALLLTVLVSCENGCQTTGPVDQGTIDATAIVLRNAARSGCVLATQPPTGDTNNVPYFQLAEATISTFLTTNDYSPGAFQAALLAIDGHSLENPYVQIAVGTVIDLYQLYWGQYVKGQVSADIYARAFLTAVQEGFAQALGKTPPASPMMARRLGVTNVTKPVLPRPIKK